MERGRSIEHQGRLVRLLAARTWLAAAGFLLAGAALLAAPIPAWGQVVVSTTTITVDEGGTAIYGVALATEPYQNSTDVVVGSSDWFAASVSPTALTFTSWNWDTPQDVTVTGVEDSDASDETVVITHVNADGNATLTVTVTDDDVRGVTVSPTSLDIDEGDSDTYTVELDTQPTGNVTVSVTRSGSPDVSASVSALTFTTSNWDTAKTVTVDTVHDDDAVDDTATVINNPSGADYGSISSATVSVTVDDDDPRGVTVSPTSLDIDEGESDTYTVLLGSAPANSGTVTVTLTVSGDDDVTVSPTALTFTTSNWDTAVSVTVDTEHDADAVDDTATVINNPSGADYGSAASVSVAVTVDDDDIRGVTVSPTSLTIDEGDSDTYTVELDTQPTGNVTVAVTRSGSSDVSASPSALTFTTSNWDTAVSVTVDTAQDDGWVDDTALLINNPSGADYGSVSSATVTVTVDDPPPPPSLVVSPTSLTIDEGDSDTYTVELNTQPTGNVTVSVTRSGSSDVSASVSALTFTASNWDTAKTVTVDTVHDDDAVDDTATVINNPSGANFGSAASVSVAVTVDDDDIRGVTVSPTSLTIDEGDSDTYTVELDTQPTGNVTVSVTRSGSPDVSASPSALTFTTSNWDTAVSVTVDTAQDDGWVDDTALLINNPSGADYGSVSSATVTVTVDDPPPPPSLVVSPTSLTIDEGDSDTYTVELNTQPTGNVTVSVTRSGSSDVSASVSALTFTASNWDTAKTVTVDTVHDDDAVDDTATVINNPSGANFGSAASVSVAVTVDDDDIRGVTVSPTSLTIDEGDSDTYTVELDTQPTGNVTVSVTRSGSPDVSASPSALTFTTSNWDTAVSVTVDTAQDDGWVDDTALLINNPSGADYGSVSSATVTVTVVDPDDPPPPPSLVVSPTSLTIDEGDSDTYTVELNTQPTGNVTVSVTRSGSSDVSASVSALTFTASNWDTAKTVTVDTVHDDDAVDDTATVINNPSGANFGSAASVSVAVTVDDDDIRGVTVSPTSLTIDEGDSDTYTVELDTQPTGNVTVSVTRSGSPDVSASPSALTFTTSNWDTAVSVTVDTAQDDGWVDDTALLINNPSGADYGSVSSATVTVTVVDPDDPPPPPSLVVSPTSLTIDEGDSDTYTVELNTQPTGNVTVSVTRSGSSDVSASVSALTFTASNWDTAKTVTVDTVHDDDAVDDTATVINNPSGANFGSAASVSVAVTVDDDDIRGVTVSPTSLTIDEGDSDTYTVELDTQPTGNVTVSVTRSGSPDVSASPSALTFTTSNWDTPQTLTVSAQEDADAVDDTATVSHAVSGADYGANGVTAASVSVTVGDEVDPVVSLSSSAVTVNENAGTVALTASLSGTSSEQVTVSYATADDTATAGSDYTANTGTLTFAAGDSSATISVSITEDAVDEDDETLTVSLSSPSNATLGSPTSSTVTITDDDVRGVTVLPTSLKIDEGESSRYAVFLDSAPADSGTVTVSLTVDNTDVTATPATLTFTDSDWDVAQSVTVSAGQDADAEDDTATVSHAVSGADYDGVAVDSVTVTVDDDETPSKEVTLTVSPASVDESGGAATLTVTGTLDAAARTQDTAVAVAVKPVTASPWDYTAGTVMLTIAAGDTSGTASLTLTPVNDAEDEADETVIIKGSTMDLTVTPATVTILDDDVRGVTVLPTSLTINEGENSRYAVVLDSAPADSGTVTVSLTLTGSSDVSASVSTLTFTNSNWNKAQAVTVSAGQDADAVNDTATVGHTVSGADYGTNGVVADSVSVTVIDDDDPSVSLSSSVTVSENAGSVTLTASLSQASSNTVTVSYATANGTATAGSDYTASSGTLTFLPDATSATLSVSITEDAVDEDDETFTLSLSGPSNATLGSPTSSTVTITDDDVRGVTVLPTSLKIDEGESSRYAVFLDSAPADSGTVTVSLTVDNTDVTATPATLTFTDSDWDVAQSVTVSAGQDADAEDDTATVSHAVSGADYDGVAVDSVTVTVDDDETPSKEVTLTVSPASVDESGGAATLTVTGTLDAAARTQDTAVAVAVKPVTASPWDYTAGTVMLTIAAGDTSGTASLTLTPVNDAEDEADETVIIKGSTMDLTVTPATVTILDDDVRGVTVLPTSLTINEGENSRYAVVLDSAPADSGTVTVSLTLTGSSDVSASVSTLTFTNSNWNKAQAVTVSAGQDADAVNDTATVGHTVSGADYGTNGVVADSVSVTVIDDDDPSVSLSSSVTVSENAGSVTLTASLSQASSNTVTVSYATANGTATAGSDYTASSGTLTFLPDATSATLSVSITEDAVDEDDETFTLSLSGPSNATLGSPTSSTVTILDDDVRGVTVLPTALTINEGGSGSYTVVLDTQPTAAVTIAVAAQTGSDGDLTANPTSLIFLSSNWDTAQAVTIAAAEDDDGVDGSATFGHSASSSDSTYDSISIDNLTATEDDNDVRGVTMSPQILTVPEGGSADYTVVLDTQPTADVTITVERSTGDTDLTASPDELTFTGANWNTAQTVTVSADEDDNGTNGIANFTHNVISDDEDYESIPIAAVRATEDDDDPIGVTVSPKVLTVPEGGSADYTLVLDTQPEADVTITVLRFTGDTDLTASPDELTFTGANWNTEQTVTVSADEDTDVLDGTAIFDHSVSSNDENYTDDAITIDSVTATEDDNDERGVTVSPASLTINEDGSGSYTVVLTSAPADSGTVTVSLTVSGDPDVTLSAAALTFTEMNWSVAQAVTVSAAEDADAVNDTATLINTPSGADYGANGVVAATVSVTVIDDDNPSVSLSSSTLTVSEDAGTVALTASLSQASSKTVTVSYATADDTATAGTDYTANTGTLTFAAGVTSETLSVSITNDAVDEDDETLTVSLSNPSNATLGSPTSSTVTITDGDTRGVTVSPTALTINEGESESYTVVLHSAPADGGTVTVMALFQTVTVTALMFTDSDWDEAQTVTLIAGQDTDAEDVTATVSHTVSGADYGSNGVTADSVSVTIIDDDVRGVTVSATALTINEGASGNYTVVLDTQPTGDVTVSLTVSGSSDVTASASALTFTEMNWSAAQAVTVSAAQDADAVNDTATLINTPSGADYGANGVVAATVSVTVLDDDDPSVSLSSSTLTVSEDAGTVALTASLSQASSKTVTVSYATADDTATAGTDYTANTGTLTFAAGVTSETLSVSITNDAVDEDDETLTVSLSNPSNATLGSPTSSTVTITDGDTRGVTVSPTALTINEGESESYTVVLHSAPADGGTVTVMALFQTVTVTALMFTDSDWDEAQTVTLIAGQDTDAEDVTATVSHTVSGADYGSNGVTADSVSVTIIDDDVRGVTVSATALTINEGASGNYTVVLDTQPTGDVTVSLTVSGSSDVTASASALTFTEMNWSAAQAVTVSAAQDADAVNDTATLINTPSGADYGANGVVAATVSVTVLDDDDPSVSLSSSTLTVSEDAGTVALTASLSQASSKTVTVSYTTADGTATADSDYTANTGTLTFAAGDTSTTISVSITNDAVDEDDETLTVSLSSPSNATLGSPTSSTVTITDNDDRGVTVSPTALTIDEDASGSYTVVLTSAPADGGTVTVSLTADNTDVTATPAALTFTDSDWGTAQAVTVSAEDDADAVDDTATVSHTVSGADYGSNGVTASSVSVSISDDDVAVCNRTAEVRDALVSASPVSACGDVTATHLAAITSLSLNNDGISALQVGDFGGLTGLTTLQLQRNDLTTLPAGVFDELSALTELELHQNGMSSLPAGAFDGLSALTTLVLKRNELTTLPAGVFDELSALTNLELHQNDLSSLPAGAFDGMSALTTLVLQRNDLTTLPAGVFDELSALTNLELHQNDLSSLPGGVFDGLSALSELQLHHNELSSLSAGLFTGLPALAELALHSNATNPLSLTVSLEAVGTDQFKAVAPTGVPFAVVLPVSVSGPGSIDGGATTVTIAAGAVESSALTVSRTTDTTAAVTADIGTLPSLPSNHGGYALVKSADLPLEVLAEVEPGLSVDDAQATEGTDATIDFSVNLSHASSSAVTVAYATANGSALSGQDYTSASGTLTFSAGDTAKTVSVTVLDDAVDEGDETFTLTLSSATGASIDDAQATGTISNSDSLPRAWLTRFGRTVAGHVTEALSERLTEAERGGSEVTLGGVRLPLGEGASSSIREPGFGSSLGAGIGSSTRPGHFGLAPHEASWDSEHRSARPSASGDRTLRDWLLGSSFRVTLKKRDEDDPVGSRWTAWGNGMASRFDGDADGLDVNGEVTTYMVGADGAWDRWLAGVAVARSSGSGGFADRSVGAGGLGRGSGDLDSTLTSVHPYVRFAISERLSTWGLLGYGRGELTLARAGSGTWHTDTAMQMAAAGARGVLTPAAYTGGLELAVRSDVLFTRMTSEAVETSAGRLAESEGSTSRLRLIVEGSRTWTLERNRTVTPSVELGLKHDGGDAETGMGVEIGAGLRFVDPGMGLSLEVKARGLLAHQDADYREWGASAALQVDPGASGRGLVLSLTPSWGAASSGVERLWSLRDPRGLTGNGDFNPSGRLEAELGYMLGGPRGRGVQTPYTALSLGDAGDRTLRVGWRLTLSPDSTLGLEGMRRQPANGDPAEHGILLQGTLRW